MSKKVPDITTDYLLDEIDKQLHLEKIKLVDRSIVEGNLFTLDEILIPEEYKTKILSTVDSGVNEFFATYLYPLALSDDRFEEYYIAIYNDFELSKFNFQ